MTDQISRPEQANQNTAAGPDIVEAYPPSSTPPDRHPQTTTGGGPFTDNTEIIESSRCVPITADYVRRVDAMTEADIVAVIGFRFGEIGEVPQDTFNALSRKFPLEIYCLLTLNGVIEEGQFILPADVLIAIYSRFYGTDPAPYLALSEADRLPVFFSAHQEYGRVFSALSDEQRMAVVAEVFQNDNADCTLLERVARYGGPGVH